jgi:Dolichyl-phosphate-mannose-protein mannosyltransferase
VSERASRVALIVILFVAALRVVSTWFVYSQTFDESTHIAAGLEWLEQGTYRGEPQHPPLARIATALGPFAAGAKLAPPDIGLAEQGNEILHSGPYLRMLSFARAGILPFFLLSIVVVWAWGRMLGGEWAGVLAALLYSNLPPVLAHAGVATTDMAVTAGIAAALYLLHRWLLAPSPRVAAFLGLATAVAITSKFSAFLFLAAGGAAILLMAWRRPVWRHAALAAAVCVLAVWAVYRFDFGYLRDAHYHLVNAWLGERTPAFPLPMPALLSGIAQTAMHNAAGHEAFLLGEYSKDGWWYYFPVAIAVKTTIVFLAVALLSPFFLRKRQLLAPFVAAMALVVACFPVQINIGIRHVLAIYPLLAVSAACALSTRRKALVYALLAVELFVSLRAHPDYLPYFNAFAGSEPQNILRDSNLDWGQDLLRLEKRARALKIEALRLSYFGTASLDRHPLPPLIPVVHDRPLPGWFAVSEEHLGSREFGKSFPWLDRFPNYERIGKSIRLYRIPGALPPGGVPSAEVLAAMERLVVPLPLGTSGAPDRREWRTELRLRNEGSVPERLLDRHGEHREIPPGGSIVWNATSDRSAWFLYIRRNAPVTGQLEVSAWRDGQRVEEPVVVPAAHESRFRSRAALRAPQGCNACARTLRIYSTNSGPVRVDILAQANGRTWKHHAVLANQYGLPAFGQFDVAATFPELGDAAAEISAVAWEHEPLWAMLTVSGERRELVASE